MICPGEEHARNKEIDLVTKKKGSIKHASNIFAYLLYIDKRNQSQNGCCLLFDVMLNSTTITF